MNQALAAALGAALIALAACAAPGEPQPPAFADDPRLGEETSRICFTSQINGFNANTSRSVVVELGVNEHYLLEIAGPCPDLDHALSLGFNERSGGCLTRGDSIIPFDTAFGDNTLGMQPRSCLIRRIYEWNPDAAEAAAPDAP